MQNCINLPQCRLFEGDTFNVKCTRWKNGSWTKRFNHIGITLFYWSGSEKRGFENVQIPTNYWISRMPCIPILIKVNGHYLGICALSFHPVPMADTLSLILSSCQIIYSYSYLNGKCSILVSFSLAGRQDGRLWNLYPVSLAVDQLSSCLPGRWFNLNHICLADVLTSIMSAWQML